MALRSKSIDVDSSGGGIVFFTDVATADANTAAAAAAAASQCSAISMHCTATEPRSSYSASQQASEDRITGRLKIVEQVSTEVGSTCVMLSDSEAPDTHAQETGSRSRRRKFDARFRRQFYVPMHDF